MAHKKPELDHTITLPGGGCAACEFLRTAIKMMAPEYRAEYQRLLDEARELHSHQYSIFDEVKP